MLSKEDVIKLFRQEFSNISDRFSVFQLSVNDAKDTKDALVTRPGVYVYWHPNHGVIKSGKSQDNSRKRALQHIRDNTANNEIQMKDLADDENTVIILFNINHDADLHWVLALEAFIEWNTSPKIRSARMG